MGMMSVRSQGQVNITPRIRPMLIEGNHMLILAICLYIVYIPCSLKYKSTRGCDGD